MARSRQRAALDHRRRLAVTRRPTAGGYCSSDRALAGNRRRPPTAAVGQCQLVWPRRPKRQQLPNKKKGADCQMGRGAGLFHADLDSTVSPASLWSVLGGGRGTVGVGRGATKGGWPEFAEGEGVLEPKSPEVCVPETAQINVSFCKNSLFSRDDIRVRRGGGFAPPPPVGDAELLSKTLGGGGSFCG